MQQSKKGLDIFTTREADFDQEIQNIVSTARNACLYDKDLPQQYILVTNAIEAIYIRKEKVYPMIFFTLPPDYTIQIAALDLLKHRILRHINQGLEVQKDS